MVAGGIERVTTNDPNRKHAGSALWFQQLPKMSDQGRQNPRVQGPTTNLDRKDPERITSRGQVDPSLRIPELFKGISRPWWRPSLAALRFKDRQAMPEKAGSSPEQNGVVQDKPDFPPCATVHVGTGIASHVERDSSLLPRRSASTRHVPTFDWPEYAAAQQDTAALSGTQSLHDDRSMMSAENLQEGACAASASVPLGDFQSTASAQALEVVSLNADCKQHQMRETDWSRVACTCAERWDLGLRACDVNLRRSQASVPSAHGLNRDYQNTQALSCSLAHDDGGPSRASSALDSSGLQPPEQAAAAAPTRKASNPQGSSSELDQTGQEEPRCHPVARTDAAPGAEAKLLPGPDDSCDRTVPGMFLASAHGRTTPGVSGAVVCGCSGPDTVDPRSPHGAPSEDSIVNRGHTGGIPLTRSVTISWDADGSKLVNGYVKGRLLGRGSYAKVVLYRHKETGAPVAMKVFSKSRLRKVRVCGRETALGDAYREIEILRRVQPHPNIIQLLEIIDDLEADKLFAVMECAEGGPVFSGTGPGGGIGEPRAREVLRAAALGLRHLHSHGIVHGDLKPDNLLLTASGTIKLCDFGVSTILEPGQSTIRRSPGTPVFSAPECCTGEPFDGRKADIWALGCTLYLCACGKYPFLGRTMEETFERIQCSPLVMPENVSAELEDLLRRLLDKDPKARASLEEVLQHPWLHSM